MDAIDEIEREIFSLLDDVNKQRIADKHGPRELQDQELQLHSHVSMVSTSRAQSKTCTQWAEAGAAAGQGAVLDISSLVQQGSEPMGRCTNLQAEKLAAKIHGCAIDVVSHLGAVAIGQRTDGARDEEGVLAKDMVVLSGV